MAISAVMEEAPAEGGQRRSPRRTLHLEVEGEKPGAGAARILIHNISADGLLIQCDLPLERDEAIDVLLPHAGSRRASVVWSSGRLFGCRFETPIDKATLSAAILRSAVDGDIGIAASNEGFGVRLQQLRETKGMTQSQLAALAGVSEAAVCAWEKGKSRPRPHRADELAAILGVSKLELIGADTPSRVADVVRQSRDRIAAAVGVPADNIRIAIEL